MLVMVLLHWTPVGKMDLDWSVQSSALDAQDGQTGQLLKISSPTKQICTSLQLL